MTDNQSHESPDESKKPAPPAGDSEAPPPSLIMPGFKQVRIVDGKRVDPEGELDPQAETPVAGTHAVDPQATPADESSLTGREATLVGTSSTEPSSTPPVSGREATLVGNTPPNHDNAAPATPISGREATLIGNNTATDQPAADTSISGREATLIGNTPTDQPPATPISGREATLVGQAPADQPPATPISGREATIVGGTPTPVTSLSGREATLVGAGDVTVATNAGNGAEDTQATIGPGQTTFDDEQGESADNNDDTAQRTPATFKPGSKPITLGPGSSASFDASWHLNGRKGPHTGQVWGDFDIGGILGEGGMGAVYRAMQKSLKRRVAIKVLPPNLAQDANLLQRFHLEASTSSKLSSPHIVQVYYIGEHDGNHYYAMEYVDGTDLYEVYKQYRDEEKIMPAEEAADYVLQGARGLAEAGRYGIVHRDIKPPNMMVDASGLLKIADFGIVKVLGDHQLTMTGQAVGTPAYCSPEQGRGDGDIDQRSDLYSLGVVFYELACGKRPFEATTPNALIYKHCFEEPELPKTVNPEISDEFQAVILRLLQKKPENRYQSADELVRDLEALKTGAMLESALANIRGTGASEAKREQMNWLQRNLVKVLAAAGLAVAAGGFGLFSFLEARNEEQRAAERATEGLKPILSVLDQAAALPPDVESILDEYEQLDPDGAEDTDLKRWRAIVARVRAAEAILAPLDQDEDSAEIRQKAIPALSAYTAEVGTDEAAAQRWQKILNDLDAEETTIRNRLRNLQTGTIDQSARDILHERAGRLAHLVGNEDPDVLQAQRSTATFDQQVASLTQELSILDSGKQITASLHGQLKAALGQLTPLLGEGDARIVRWGQTLDNAGGLVADLRDRLQTALGTSSRLSLNTIDEIQGDLGLFSELVDESDRDITNWRAQIKASHERIAALRQRLTEWQPALDERSTLASPILPPLQNTLADLTKQTGQGDADVIKWNTILRNSEGRIQQLRQQLQRLALSNPQPISVDERENLTLALTEGIRKEAIDQQTADAYQQRITDETERVAALRERLAMMDQASPFSAALEQDLARLRKDISGPDTDLDRWIAKRDQILALRESLAVLNSPRPVGDDLTQRFASLTKLVSADAPEIQRWQPKVTLIGQLLERLAPLRQRTSLPETAVADLNLLAEQVSREDPTWIDFHTKVSRVQELSASLRQLEDTVVISPELHSRAHAEFTELVELIGIDDPAVRHAAKRIEEIDGPSTPAWAIDHGRDQFGRWADLAYDDLRMRLRYIPPGTFVMGSDNGEADEVPVQMTLSTGFWIADREVTQTWWSHIMGETPSYFTGKDHPVERIHFIDAQAFLLLLNERCGLTNGRLPTEVEWEFACRAGPQGDAVTTLSESAWIATNSRESTHPVAERYANPLGLYDMLGNVAEWTADGYAAYPTSATVDHFHEVGDDFVARGGSWGDPAHQVRASNRIAVDPKIRSMYLGMRVAASAEFDQTPDGTTLLAALSQDSQRQTYQWDVGNGISLTISLPEKPGASNPQATPSSEPTTTPIPESETAP